MDELGKFFWKVHETVGGNMRTLDENAQAVLEKLDKLITADLPEIASGKPKKKALKLSVIAANSDFEDSTSSGRMASPKENIIKAKSKKIPCIESNAQSESNNDQSSIASSRPSRAAKLKIEHSLKEASLSTKLRQPATENASSAKTKIKEEKTSDILPIIKENTTSSKGKIIEIQKRKSEDIDENETNASQSSSKKLDDNSLEIVNNNEPLTIDLCDDEFEKMPPPTIIPTKRVTRSKQGLEQSTRIITRSIKVEKKSLVSTTSSVDENSAVNTEVSGSEETSVQSKGRKARKGKLHRPIKEEEVDPNQGAEENLKINNSEQKNIAVEQKPKIRQSARNKKKNTSMESIYEDAVSESIQKPVEQKSSKINGKGSEISNEQITSSQEQQNDKAVDATFISAVDVSVKRQTPNHNDIEPDSSEENRIQDNIAQHTFVLDKNNGENVQKEIVSNLAPYVELSDATFNIAQQIKETDNKAILSGDATFLVDPPVNQLNEENFTKSQNSILTEDDSEDEFIAPVKLRIKKKMKNELFSPFTQSPVKKKVEAFEKHAHEVNKTPLAQRQTRTRTRALTARENKDPASTNTIIKATTPIPARTISKYLTPTQPTTITPQLGTYPLKKTVSATKVNYTKPASKVPTLIKTPSVSRDSSNEDLKRGMTKFQQLEEKKKKREQKQQLAAQARDAKEKEREEKLKKMMEEKARRQVELEHKKQLDEISRALRQQEEKREQQKRLEKIKQMEMSEAEKKERDIADALKVLKAKEKLNHERKLLEQKKNAKKNAYNFEMLNSDDSTDDEGKPKTKRPAVPLWSLSSVRQPYIESQANVPTRIIDCFFSVEPMTPDLRQIFPSIDPKYLKRNSSVFWKTPPRYSQLPK